MVGKEEGEAARRKEEAGDEGKAVAQRFGIAAVAGKRWGVAEGGTTEAGGRGERGSANAEGGRRICTGDDGTGEEEEEGGTGSW